MASTVFLCGVTALVACKIGIRIGVDAARFGDLPRPNQID